jgi:hypothetical protein
MSRKRKPTFDELMNAPTPKTFVSEAIDYTDVAVKESATERARRRWNMPAQEEPNLSACAKLKALE